mgnify:FL=1
MAKIRSNPIESSNQPYWIVGICLSAMLVFTGCRKQEPAVPDPSEEGDAETSIVPESKQKGDLVFTPPIFEAEAKAGEETVDAHFTVKNVGRSQITITRLDTTCSCLLVEAADTVLDPGETTSIDAVFEITKLLGHAEKMIEVYTDQNKGRPIFLPVKVDVPPILEVTPKNVTWKLGGPVEPKSFKFITIREKPIHVTEVSSSRPDLVTVSLKEITKGREYEIVVTPKSTDDNLLGFVKIETDLEIKAHQSQMAFFTISKSEF